MSTVDAQAASVVRAIIPSHRVSILSVLSESEPEEMVEWTFLDAPVFDVLQKHLPPEVQAAPETYQLRTSFTWPAGGPGGTELEKVVPIRNDGLLARRFAEVAEPEPAP